MREPLTSPYAPDLQEAAQVHISAHAFVWSSLHGVHGPPLH